MNNPALRTLRPYQKQALWFIKRLHTKAGLAMDVGTGKTITSIRAAHRPCLVLCRRDDYMTWRLELEADGTPADKIQFIEAGDQTLQAVPAHDAHPTMNGPDWTICTYDLCKNDRISAYLKTCPFECVIADEIQLLQYGDTARTKKVYAATRHIPRRLGLSGTLFGNDPYRNAFHPTRFLDDGATLGENEYAYLNRFFLQPPAGHGWFIKKSAKTTVKDLLAKRWLHIAADDVIKDLPPPKPIVKSAPMSKDQARITDQILNEWEIRLDENTEDAIELDYIIVQMQKLRQIASGFLYIDPPDGGPRKTEYFDCPKLDLLYELLGRDGQFGDKKKVVIWCSMKAEIDRIAGDINNQNRRLGKFVTYYGKQSRKNLEEARHQFREDPRTRFFIGQADRGVGMNELIVADTSIWFSNSLRVMSRKQAAGRTRRIGSQIHKQINYVDLLTEHSIDIKIRSALHRHMSVATEILNGLKRGLSPRVLTGVDSAAKRR